MKYTAKVKSLKEVIKQEIRGSHLQNLILKKNQLDFLLEHEDQRLTFELIRSDNIFLYKEQKIPAEWLTDMRGMRTLGYKEDNDEAHEQKDKRESFFSHNKNKDIKELIDILIEEDKKQTQKDLQNAIDEHIKEKRVNIDEIFVLGYDKKENGILKTE